MPRCFATTTHNRSLRRLAFGFWLLPAVCTALGASPAWGQCAQEQKLTAEVGFDAFGISVSVDGDTAVVGAIGTGELGTEAAYVFVRAGGVWTLQQKLTASDAEEFDAFGWSVSVSGDTAVIGAITDGGPNDDSGSAYVFVRTGGVWIEQQKLTALDGTVYFGNSVSVSGDTIVVGAPFDDIEPNYGSAYVFVRSGGVWTQQQKLTASEGPGLDSFGHSVSISGETIVVGADGTGETPLEKSGAAYVFVRSGGAWTQQQKLTASDAAAFDQFGFSVSVYGDMAIVGAVHDDDACPEDPDFCNSGSAYVFVRSGGAWTQQQKLTASDAGQGQDGFGVSVSVNGDKAVVGEQFGAAAFVFVRAGGVWTELQKLTAWDEANSQFSDSVSVSGDTAVIGSAFGEAPAYIGAAYVFSCAPCSPPDCNNHGTCDGGTCSCDAGFAGAACDQCAPDYYDYPTCLFCLAATTCSGNGTCNALGGCNCNVGFAGTACDQCAPGYVNYPTCVPIPAPPGVGDDMCVGGTNAGLACAQHSDCPGGACQLKNRFITAEIPATANGLKVNLVSIDANSVATPANYNGTDRWVGAPSLNVGDGVSPSFNAAKLQCAFFSTDWSAVGPLHMYGDVVVPSSTYDAFVCSGPGGPCSTALRIGTAKFGDIVTPLVTSQPNFQDIVSIVDKFQNKPTGPSKTRTKLREPVDPAAAVGFLEVSADVDAFKGKTYKQVFSTPPATCP